MIRGLLYKKRPRSTVEEVCEGFRDIVVIRMMVTQLVLCGEKEK